MVSLVVVTCVPVPGVNPVGPYSIIEVAPVEPLVQKTCSVLSDVK